jgi:hypothetical protein
MYELIADTGDYEEYDYEPATIETEGAARRAGEPSPRLRPLPRPAVSIERPNTPARQETRVETSRQGRRTLVNEMRSPVSRDRASSRIIITTKP